MKIGGSLYQLFAYTDRNQGVIPSRLLLLDKWTCRLKNFYELWTLSLSEMLFYHKCHWLRVLKVTDPNPRGEQVSSIGFFSASFTSSSSVQLYWTLSEQVSSSSRATGNNKELPINQQMSFKKFKANKLMCYVSSDLIGSGNTHFPDSLFPVMRMVY